LTCKASEGTTIGQAPRAEVTDISARIQDTTGSLAALDQGSEVLDE